MRTYEVLFIVSPQLSDDDAKNVITEFRSVAEKAGATIASEDAWGRRRLASPINKITEGTYHLFVIQANEDPHELDRRMKNSDQILRHLIVRTDLDLKRATKLAKKNPPKVRAGAGASAAAAAAANAVAPTVEVPAPAPAAPAATAEVPAEAPAAPAATAEEAPAAETAAE